MTKRSRRVKVRSARRKSEKREARGVYRLTHFLMKSTSRWSEKSGREKVRSPFEAREETEVRDVQASNLLSGIVMTWNTAAPFAFRALFTTSKYLKAEQSSKRREDQQSPPSSRRRGQSKGSPFQELLPDSLDHLYRNNSIERSFPLLGHRPVVEEVDGDGRSHASLLDSSSGEGSLLS